MIAFIIRNIPEFKKLDIDVKLPILVFIICLLVQNNSYSQEIKFKKTSIRTAIGIGINEGKREEGIGLMYSIGWQKSLGEKNRLRINPNMMIGGFSPVIITHSRDQFYRITTAGLNIHYDLIQYKALSLVATGGGFINYSRGLLGTGGRQRTYNQSEYFYSLYFGGNGSVGIRVDPEKSKFAYEVRPINVHVGNKGFILGYLMFGIDFKLME